VQGELVQLGAEHMQEHLDALLKIIIDSLQDQSSALKREIALRALRQLVSGTGSAIQPYLDHPELMGLLLKIIKREVAPHVRLEAVKALGTLGAIDPHELHKTLQSDSMRGRESTLMPLLDQSQEEYNIAHTLNALVRILNNATLIACHVETVDGLFFIMKTTELKALLPLLPKVMPPFLATVRACERSHKPRLLNRLSDLVSLVKESIKQYLADMILLVEDFWDDIALLTQVLELIQKLSDYMPMEFKPHMPSLLPKLIGSLQLQWRVVLNDQDGDHVQVAMDHCHRLLNAFETFGSMLEDYLYLIIPQLIAIVEHRGVHGTDVKTTAALTLGALCATVNMTEYSSRIVLPLARVLQSKAAEERVKVEVIRTLCNLVTSIGYEFAIFIPVMESVTGMLHSQVSATKNSPLATPLKKYDSLVSKVLTAEYVHTPVYQESLLSQTPGKDTTLPTEQDEKFPIDHDKLAQAWDTTQRSTKEDWTDWFRKFSIELLRQSPSGALRSCEAIVQLHPPLASELFHAAFVACWSELYDTQQNDLVKNLESAICSKTVPPHVLQMLLNLAEFMDHDDKPLPIDIRTLAEISHRSQAFAKALHYWELQFDTNPKAGALLAYIT
jgi:FKBP12-rapamycin complex-associated protein